MRCYNGCPDTELQAVWDAKADMRKKLDAMANSLGASAYVTYFPLEGKWLAFSNYKMISGFNFSEEQTYQEAMKFLQNDKGEL